VLPAQVSELHEFQVLVRMTGPDTTKARGQIEWKERPITLHELKALREVVQKMLKRLDDAIEGK
jgi:hypothetical protein